ncbi:MAG: phosphate ABC transporter substrate-binding protein [Thermoleophilia bacterium]|nr:phosphate ABC transporter substrate-binding protein [Thermoleophilia bacterium]
MKNARYKRFAALALTAALAVLAASCGETAGSRNSFEAKGSDTMVNLSQMWAEEYMKENPQISIAVTGGGSGTGISAMINGTTDIANSSREMKEEEKAEAEAKGVEVVENLVALDGLAVIVHPGNSVTELSIDELAGLFTGRISDWQEVGGEPGPIVLLSRESNSGTHVFFKEHVLNEEEFAPRTLLLPSSQQIIDELVNNPRAIGYVGLGYVSDGVRTLEVKEDEASPGIEPNVASVQDGSYPISRPLFVYSKQDSPQVVLDFLEWIMGPQGQKVVEELEFVPLNQ